MCEPVLLLRSYRPRDNILVRTLCRQPKLRVTMDAGIPPARQARAQHRHELRTLTYVTLDQANGGIVRNLTNSGIGVQVVAAVRPKQQLRVRFELRYPRLHVETRAEVVWATFSGQCGIRFLDMPPVLQQQINQWIFGNLLEGISLYAGPSETIFAPRDGRGTQSGKEQIGNAPIPGEVGEDDGLLVAATPVKVIELPMHREPPETVIRDEDVVAIPQLPPDESGWLARPLAGRTLAWTVDVLVVFASLLLFTLVFLWVTREAPPWPFASVAGAALMMAGMYWGFFRLLAGGSLGAKLARIAETDAERDGPETRFR